MSSLIINNLKNIKTKSYLELGVFDNSNFNQINAKEKFSVDMNGNAMFTGTTDEYFEQLDPSTKFDIIFIDANHDYDYVIRDFNNSINHCNEWILMHDMIPPKKKHTKPHKCSDSYKVLYYLLTTTDFEIYPMNNNFGFTLIRMPAFTIHPHEQFSTTSYELFMDFINRTKLYSDEEIITLLKK